MDTLNQMTLGARVRYFRKLRKLTQTQLADMAHTNQQQITSIENDETNSPRNLEQIAAALGIPATLLRYGIIALDECHVSTLEIADKIDQLSDDDREIVVRLIDKLVANSK